MDHSGSVGLRLVNELWSVIYPGMIGKAGVFFFFPKISNSCCVGIVVLGQISRNGPGILFAGRGACGMGCSHHK